MAYTVGLSIPDAHAQQIRVVPSLAVMEQYDSNVFFAPKGQLAAGTKADDLISTFTPQLNLMHSNTAVKTNLAVGAVIQKFVHNSALDNVGFNASAGIDLTQAVNRILPRMTGLRIFGIYRYSPSTPAFGAGGLGGGGMGGMGGGMGGFGMGGFGMGGFGMGGMGLAGIADSGLLTQRIRTTMYTVGLSDSYALSPTTDFQMTYTHSQLSFSGSSLAPVSTVPGASNNTVFDTSTHNISVGPVSRISAVDTLTLRYTFSNNSQAQFGSFTIHNGTAGWGRAWSKEWSSFLNGGLTLIEPIPDSTAIGGNKRIPATIFPTGNVSVSYASGSSFLRKLGSEIQEATGGGSSGGSTGGGGFLPMMQGMNMPGGIASTGSYRLTMMYNLGVFPSFVQSAGPIYTHMIMLGGMAGITDKLTAQALFNFSRSTFAADAIGTTFSSYGTRVSLSYLITPTFTTSLSHQWLMFDSQSSGVVAADYGFAKHLVLLAFTYAYAPRGDFFKSGAFWDSPSGGSSSSEAGKSGAAGGSGGVEIKK